MKALGSVIRWEKKEVKDIQVKKAKFKLFPFSYIVIMYIESPKELTILNYYN